ncbi:hypothetical protein EDD21DRAFT_440195 [Dissophora ornata]|nr:hypothetical protein EDD21DRAFT_440195 [Dissophora ornata]
MSDNSQRPSQPPASGVNPPRNSQSQATLDSSASSFMSKFYTPMNPNYTSQQQHQQSASSSPPPLLHNQTVPRPPPIQATGDVYVSTSASGPSIGANAALLLANLTTIPGFLSETAIQEARREYSQRQSVAPFTAPIPIPDTPATASAPHVYQPPHLFTHPPSTSAISASTDPGASIGALLKELQQSRPSSSPLAPRSHLPTAPETPIAPQESLPPSTPHVPQPSSQPRVLEDYSNGKITPQLLKRLATIAEMDAQGGGTLLTEISSLREKQISTERRLYEDRQALLAAQKKDLVKLQASEIMGMNVTSEIRKTKANHSQQLKQFDKNVIYEMDKMIALVQESLAKVGVPMMNTTQDPAMIESQIKVLRLLDDMLQT